MANTEGAPEQLNLKVKSQVTTLSFRMEKKCSSRLSQPHSSRNSWMHIANDKVYILLYQACSYQREVPFRWGKTA